MPACYPILYGTLKPDLPLGVRGGAGVNVKILDQPWASQGQLGILAIGVWTQRSGLLRQSMAVKVSHS